VWRRRDQAADSDPHGRVVVVHRSGGTDSHRVVGWTGARRWRCVSRCKALGSGGVCAEPEVLTPISRADRLRAMNGWVGIDASVWVGRCRDGQIGSSSVRKLVALGGEWESAKAFIGTVP